jgi:hypothetical protein
MRSDPRVQWLVIAHPRVLRDSYNIMAGCTWAGS